MPDNTNRTLTPKLRFPEFRKGTAWDTHKVGAKTASFSGGTPDTSAKEYYGGSIPFIRSAEIGEESTELTLTEAGLNSSAAKLIVRGDVLVALYGANSGDVALAKIDGAINQAILCLRSVDNNGFLFQYLSAKKDWITTTYLQGGQGNLSGDIVKSVVLGFPTNDEQHKIAACLTSLDELIAAQGRKVEALKAHKKSLMQQLFPREGETLPRLRFPEFRNTWTGKKLEELSESISSGKDKADENGIFDLHGSTGVIGKTMNGAYSGTFLLVARVGANSGLMTRVAGAFGVTDNTLVITLKAKESIDFIFYCLDNVGLNKMIFGSGQPLITGGQLKALTIQFPEIREQQRIADCLSTLDARIAAEADKLAALKTHKQALMQQLFPNSQLSAAGR